MERLFPPDSYDGHCLPKFYPEKNKIYPFYVMRLLSEKLQKGSTLVSDGGAALIYTLQAFKLKDNQRLISSTGLELLRFAISGSIGACVSSNFGSVITICEDRGLNLSSPELQTIAEYDLPIKILVLKSYGHSIIRNIQRDYFGSRYVATDNEINSGSSPVTEIPSLFGIKSFKAENLDELGDAVNGWLASSGPAICEVVSANDQDMIPRPSFLVRGIKNGCQGLWRKCFPKLIKKLKNYDCRY